VHYWTFCTQHGLWSIKRSKDGLWHTWVNDEDLGSYHSPVSALEDLVNGAKFSVSQGIDTAAVGLPAELSDWVLLKRK
jgi:hypothetical protein